MRYESISLLTTHLVPDTCRLILSMTTTGPTTPLGPDPLSVPLALPESNRGNLSSWPVIHPDPGGRQGAEGSERTHRVLGVSVSTTIHPDIQKAGRLHSRLVSLMGMTRHLLLAPVIGSDTDQFFRTQIGDLCFYLDST